MSKNNFKLSAVILLFTLAVSGCGTVTEPAAEIVSDNVSVSGFSPDDSSIPDQIRNSTIGMTDWGTNVKSLPVLKSPKKATLLSYLAFNNDKGGFRNELPPVINLHELAGSSGLMNVIMESFGIEPNDAKLYYIVPDNDKNKIISPYTQFPKQLDAANYRTLQDYLKWGFSTYPSQKKLLTINNHGGAYLGIARDDGSGKIMSVPALARAIGNGAGRVDVLSLDACLMSTMEVGYELRNAADVMVGSEDSTIGTGMMYASSLPQIITQSANNEEIARGIILESDRKGVKNIYLRPNRKGRIPNVFTISAFRGSQMENVSHELNNLARLLLANMAAQKQAAKMAFGGAHPLSIDDDETGGQRDLYEVLSRLNTVITDLQIKEAILRAKDALNKAIIISRANNSEKYSQGMAINISPVAVQSPEYQATAFAKDTLWDELITAVNK
jgi:hypothetical protein